ncbi:chromosome segregation protein BIR1 [Aspergillus vadensis CBS 113365]|uniref:Chromosome segregation protein BIR1 n=1 Tax=Aspergillus vadensis (strain CBS 113365 / IMI 142717 / IBT 24658) TaxID=1448311 RepID=A0A319BCA7_ASPVC|nr:chromosome segregation protein BIR1 [Aspergillus vadensis CBS 113365]PYH68310.1 chromosome segregation protein BIR1 [Aspergillus vadensis CBS 113365]
MAQEMETFAARLASFDRVLYPEKRRSSSAKSAKPIAWPHSRPSPAELAHAGFFYNPYETNPDNTTCFLCRRALDGWEEDDNPITEHLKHTRDCGWAIMMDIQQHSSNPAEIEDPTSERIAQARQATFGESWPHDGKRGWYCQSDKMVEGGWYFCPNEESNDLATCPYCKLSLDGWEPKDDPFDEHYRRSSDCSFFVFAKPSGKKGKSSRSKKSRVSKASRLSTQSTASEAPVSELDDPVDQSTLSQSTTKTKSSKKSSKSKSKTKSKKEEVVDADSQMDIDTTDYSQPEPKKTKRTRGKKRTSDELNDDAELVDSETVEKPERPAKKRATKSRDSTQQEYDSSLEAVKEDVQVDDPPVEEEKPKKSRGTKKKTTSKSRKVSTDSAVSRAASEIPPTQEHDAAMDVDQDLEKPDEGPSEEPQPKPLKKSKSKSKKKAKADPEPSKEVVEQRTEPESQEEMIPEPEKAPEPEPEPPVEEVQQTRRTSRRQSARVSDKLRQSSHDQESPQPVTQPEPEPTTDAGADSQQHESFVSVEIPARNSEQGVGAAQKDKESKKTKKKASAEKQRASKQAEQKVDVELDHEESHAKAVNKATDEPKQQPDTPQQLEQGKPQSQTPDQPSARRRSSRVPPKTVERYSDIPREKQYARSLAESRNSHVDPAPEDNHQPGERPEPATVSPLPSPSKSTLSLSPQSSDAENQPPSLKPSVNRAPVASPSKQVRIPLAASTPSPSKRGANTNSLKTSHPWTPIDIDGIILAGGDKENIDFGGLHSGKGDLTSPEKKMTVEEWIKWNAKNGEEKLKQECERLVSQFEREGARAMRVLEGIECID